MSNLDQKQFAKLCREFIDAATPAIHNSLECDTEPETPDRIMHNLRFIFTSVMPFLFKDTALELATLLGTKKAQERLALRQDQAALLFADMVAKRLLEDHSLYAIQRFVPVPLNTDKGRSAARTLNLPHLAKIL